MGFSSCGAVLGESLNRLKIALACAIFATTIGMRPASALAVDVVCTLPWLGSITQEIAPDARVTVLAKGTEDPHFLSPTPALMSSVTGADLFIENGLNLELWSQRLIDGAGNPKIRRGQPGYVLATAGVKPMEIPSELTRARGDLHPQGNPHVWLDPLNAPIVADNIAAGLGRVDPSHAAQYQQRAKAFRARVYERTFGKDLVDFMGGPLLERLARGHKLRTFLQQKGLNERLGGWMREGDALHGKPIIFYHQSWTYFIDRFGLKLVGYIEDRPGISPSAAHRHDLVDAMIANHVQIIGVIVYYDHRLAHALARDTEAKVVRIPGDVGGDPEATDWFRLIDTLIHQLGS